MKNKILDSEIEVLTLNDNVVKKLKNNNINYVKDLWSLSRKDLKNLNFSDRDIQGIIIKLQLKGLDLNKKKY
jgi:DNA-directed RNA polymerase alpha subunit